MEWMFNKNGVASAIIAGGNCIYSRLGIFAAWIRGNNVYGLSGKHIGWYENGILYDSSNRVLGFIRGHVGHLPSTPGICGVPGIPGLSGHPGCPGFSGIPGRPGFGGWSSYILEDYLLQK